MKKKHPLLRFIVLVLIIAAAYFIYKNYNIPKTTAEDLSFEFTNNIENANEKFLNKELKITGEVRALYRIMNTRQVLELSTSLDQLPIICFFKTQSDEYDAQKLRENDIVTLKGVCLGTAEYSYVKGVKIDVISFSKN